MVGEGMGYSLDAEQRNKPFKELVYDTVSTGDGPDVVGLGDVIVDAVIDLTETDDTYQAVLEAEDWYPAAGESVAVDAIPAYVEELPAEERPGGRGPNQSTAAAQSGADTAFLGRAPDDSIVMDALAANDVDTTYVDQDPAKEQSTSYVFTAKNGENRIAFTRGANSIMDAGYVTGTARDVMQDAEYVLLNNGEPDAVLHHVLDIVDGMADGPTAVFDPAPADGAEQFLDYDAVDIVTPNSVEYQALAEDLDAYDGTVIRTSADGVTIDGDYHVRAPDVDVVDTTGAGDTFNGYLAGCQAQGMPLVTATLYATHAASLSVTGAGAQAGMPTFDEVEQFLADR
jgi:ribokinase